MINFIKTQIQKHPKLFEVFKFLVVGGLATLIDTAVMAVVIYLFDPSRYSHKFLYVFTNMSIASTAAVVCGTAAGFVVSVVFNYALSVSFVFNSADTGFAKSRRGFIIFVLLAAGGLFIHTAGMYIGYDLLGFNEWAIKITLTAVVLFYNYMSRKKLIFNLQEKNEKEDG